MSLSRNSQGLPSPAATADSPAPSLASTVAAPTALPRQRHHALAPGSSKEIALINYLDDRVLRITRRYGTKFTNIETRRDEAPGYTTLDELIEDIDPLIDLVWASGTPALEIPYLLSFAGLISTYLLSFPFTAGLFRVTKRLDQAFADLLQPDASASPARHTLSTTEKVRLKSIVEETRVNAVNKASSLDHPVDIEDLTDLENSDDVNEQDITDEDYDEEHDHVGIALSKIYKSTLQILGDSLIGTQHDS